MFGSTNKTEQAKNKTQVHKRRKRRITTVATRGGGMAA